MTEDIKEVLDFAIALARKAGAVIAEGSAKRIASGAGYQTKLNSADLLTETDQQTEKVIKEAIAERYPSHGFIGEETAQGNETVPDGPCWIVDPIDGTTNFTRAMPWCCTSIAFADGGEPVVGVVYSPFLDHLYYGAKGQGAFLVTGQDPTPRKLPLAPPQPLPSLRQALIAMEWGNSRRKDVLEAKLSSFRKLCGDPSDVEGGQMVQGVRSMGSAALVSASVGAGTIDAYYEIGTWAWDQAAGSVIAREAGGVTVGSKEWTEKAFKNGQIGSLPSELITGRKYLTVRAIADTPEEKGRDAQARIIKEFFDAVVEFDP